MRILIAGDQQHARRSLSALVRAAVPQSEVREAASAPEAARLAAEVRPRLVILDMPEPDAQGLSAAREIRTLWPETRILVVTLHRCPLGSSSAFADAVVTKGESPDDLLAALSSLL